jgi:hypothetical protein
VGSPAVTRQLELFDDEVGRPVVSGSEAVDELSPEEEAIVRDMQRPRPTGPRPEPCAYEKPLLFRDEYGEVSCKWCGREPRR